MERMLVDIGGDPIKEVTIKLIDSKDLFVEANSSKVFTQRPGSNIITVKDYFKYMLAAQAKASFARYIVDTDKDCIYHYEEIIEVPDDKALADFIEDNREKKAAYDTGYEEIKKAHPDWFETQTQVENIAAFTSPYLNSTKLYVPKDLVSIVDSYKFANISLKYLGKAESLPRTSKKVVSNQFKEDLKKLTSQLKEETGFQTEAELKKACIDKGYITADKKTHLKMSRQAPTNTKELASFAESFAEFVFEQELNRLLGR